ncbi:MAG: hypothetical protein Q8O92_02600 [Candidatus Latescibacter sp.]|nr:hypothetical protein [Candidatus Latescibacter sp.]
MKYITSLIVPAILFLLVFSGIAGAQETKRPGPPGEGPRGQEHEAQFREWVWSNLQHFLNLDENTGSRFRPVFQEYSAVVGKLMREHNGLIRSIDKNADNLAVPISEMRERAQRLTEVKKALIIEREKYYQKAKAVLNERQQIKLLIYEDKVKEDIFRRLGKRSDSEKPSQPGGPPPRR